MSEQQRFKIAIIGCGNIATPYIKDLQTYPDLEILGVADIDQARADQFAAENNTRAYPGVDALLADPDVQLVVNLTIPQAHKSVIRRHFMLASTFTAKSRWRRFIPTPLSWWRWQRKRGCGWPAHHLP